MPVAGRQFKKESSFVLDWSACESGHDPVLLDEIIDLLRPRPGAIAVDCTLGCGGHSGALAARLGSLGLLIAIDADLRNLEQARTRLSATGSPIRFFHANFAEISEVLASAGVQGIDLLLADLGLSTNQLFDERYGLSFSQPMPLDMRIDTRETQTAADVVNHWSEEDLANVLYQLAQERYSRRIARKIVQARAVSPITTTDRLADIVRSAIPARGGAPMKIDPATRTFLALRMVVNQELENLRSLLEQGPRLLRPLGRMGVISFQSTEDRLVKQAFRSAEQTGLVQILTPKPISPSPAEISRNPRSRSAKLRAVQRVGAV